MTDQTVAASQDAIRKIAIILFFSIILGICLQFLTLGTRMLGGAGFPGLRFIVDIFGSITWSVLVCIGIGLGTMIMRSGVALAGILGAAFAPFALVAAKAFQKGVGLMLGVPDPGVTGALVLLGLIKAVEYGFLGAMLALMMKREDHDLKRYVGLGLATGVVFGPVLVGVGYWIAKSGGGALTGPQIAGKTVNEVLFPIGCALVIYAVQFMSRHIRIVQKVAPDGTAKT